VAGLGLRRLYRAEAECQLRLDGSRLLTPPWGLSGGHPGGRGDFRSGDGVEPFVSGHGTLRAGPTRVRLITPADRPRYVVERLVDTAARELRLDPADGLQTVFVQCTWHWHRPSAATLLW
jgi:hypothetical protein